MTPRTAAGRCLVLVTAVLATGIGPASAGDLPDDAVDLQIADTAELTAASSCVAAGPYVDDQTVRPLDLDGAAPGDSARNYVCVRNLGDEPAVLEVAIVDAADTETGCNADEAAAEQQTAGPGCGTTGELGADLVAAVTSLGVGADGRCSGPTAGSVTFPDVSDRAGRPMDAVLAPGGHACLRLDVAYVTFDPTRAARNQTDRTTWRYRIDGTSLTPTDPASAAPSTTRGVLAVTGGDVAWLTGVALGMIALGVLLVQRSRRRRGDSATRCPMIAPSR